jgi:hypothetical protein
MSESKKTSLQSDRASKNLTTVYAQSERVKTQAGTNGTRRHAPSKNGRKEGGALTPRCADMQS